MSRGDFEYLQGVRIKLQEWRNDKLALEENIASLENKLESKNKALFTSCKGIRDLEERHWKTSDAVESRRKHLNSMKKSD